MILDDTSDSMRDSTVVMLSAVLIPVLIIAVIVLISNIDIQNDDPSGSVIEIVDGSGATIRLDSPIESCIIVNTGNAQATAILGQQSKVKDILFYKAKKVETYRNMGFDIPDDSPVFSNLSSAEWLIDTGVKYIIEPAGSSSKLKEEVADECARYGITIIRLDCYGDTMFQDMEKLIKLFGSNLDSVSRYNDYVNRYNGVVEAVTSKAPKDKTFLCYYQSLKAFYNEKSDMSVMLSSVLGKNALDGLGFSTTGVTNKIDTTNMYEELKALDSAEGIDMMIIRATADASETAVMGYWNSTDIKKFQFAYMDGNVYSFDSDIMSGSMGYICYAAMASVLGIDCGYSVSQLIVEHNSLYGTDKRTDGIVYQYVFDNGICISVNDVTS